MKRLNVSDCKNRGEDLTNFETLKQIAINTYTDNGLILMKIRKTKLGDGFRIYHEFGYERSYNKKVIVKKTDTYTKFYRQAKTVSSDFIPTEEGITMFENYVNRSVAEALRRKQ